MNKIMLVALALILELNVFGQSDSPARSCDLQRLAINAALGDSGSLYDLAVHFYAGNGVEKDWTKSAILWGQAVKAGVLPAHNNLGYLNYYGGNGYTANPSEGVRLWRIAATKGFSESQVHLGTAYFDGIILPVNLVEAYAWSETGKVTSARLEDEQMAKAISSMADTNLNDLIKRMTSAQMAAAKAKTKLYVSRYSPKASR